jgi:nitrogen fixation protein NifX
MHYRIAAASTDGNSVHQHVEQADQFIVYEFTGEKFEPLTVRHTQQADSPASHTLGHLGQTIGLLWDCRVVLVSQTGPGARAVFAQHGIEVHETPGRIEIALSQVAAAWSLKSVA